MNQPTRKEFEEFKQEIRQEVKHLREQLTEPITIPRIELDPGGIQNRLDNHAEILREISHKQDEQEEQLTLIYTDVGHMKTDIGQLKGDVGTLKTDMAEVKAEVLKIRESQADQRDTLKEHSHLLQEQGTKLDRIITFLETKGME